MLRRHLRRIVTAGCLGIAACGIAAYAGHWGSAYADDKKEERHPHIHHAIHELLEAKKELEKADHDFGGHRVDAIKAIDVAVEQLERALKFDKK